MHLCSLSRAPADLRVTAAPAQQGMCGATLDRRTTQDPVIVQACAVQQWCRQLCMCGLTSLLIQPAVRVLHSFPCEL